MRAGLLDPTVYAAYLHRTHLHRTPAIKEIGHICTFFFAVYMPLHTSHALISLRDLRGLDARSYVGKSHAGSRCTT